MARFYPTAWTEAKAAIRFAPTPVAAGLRTGTNFPKFNVIWVVHLAAKNISLCRNPLSQKLPCLTYGVQSITVTVIPGRGSEVGLVAV
jgi:hypothetical protein